MGQGRRLVLKPSVLISFLLYLSTSAPTRPCKVTTRWRRVKLAIQRTAHIFPTFLRALASPFWARYLTKDGQRGVRIFICRHTSGYDEQGFRLLLRLLLRLSLPTPRLGATSPHKAVVLNSTPVLLPRMKIIWTSGRPRRGSSSCTRQVV